MCGIIGYIGKTEINKNLVTLLKNLEYRGYDSAGTAVMSGNEIMITRSVGNISNLEKILQEFPNTNLGIAHTRWATHGKATTNNTHPHTDFSGEIALVHNGIIENYAELKNELIKKYNISFYSETDTEVIANLISVQKESNFLNKLVAACKKLNGSFALAVINKLEPNKIYLAKNKSPLYVAENEQEIIIASDPICFCGKTINYYSLNDMEFGVACANAINDFSSSKCKRIDKEIKNNIKKPNIFDKNNTSSEKPKRKISFFDSLGKSIKKTQSPLNISSTENGKNNYPHFMIKEIEESKSVLERIANIYAVDQPLKKIDKKFIENYNKIILVGCGTAYHASLMGARYLEKIAKIETRAYIASEFRYSTPLVDKNSFCIFVSQSGETADTIACMEYAKKLGATTIALTNVLYSTLAQNVDFVLPVCAGREIAVASTKAYTAQIAILYMLALKMKNEKENINIDYISKILDISKKINKNAYKIAEKVAKDISKHEKVFFIGRDMDYLTCEEASLKLKEISYINCSALPAGELKHGFLALIENGTPVFVVATNPALLDKTLNGANEALSRGADIILLSNIDVSQEKRKDFKEYITIPSASEDEMPILSVIFFQLLAYHTSLKKGLNPDQPRNLAKSVTVE